MVPTDGRRFNDASKGGAEMTCERCKELEAACVDLTNHLRCFSDVAAEMLSGPATATDWTNLHSIWKRSNNVLYSDAGRSLLAELEALRRLKDAMHNYINQDSSGVANAYGELVQARKACGIHRVHGRFCL